MKDPAKIKICPIDNVEMIPIFESKILSKYDIQYFQCPRCKFVQTESPFWLDEAYNDAIADIDVGIVARNIHNRKMIEPVLKSLCGFSGKIVDIGGGYGLLTRSLRDIGFDCFWQDKYCENIFSKGYEAYESLNADLLLAFEVFEHTVDPIKFLTDSFSEFGTKNILFSTLTYNEKIFPKEWWYLAKESGQHISFFSPKTLGKIAENFGLQYTMLNNEFHIFSEDRLNPLISLEFRLRFILDKIWNRSRNRRSRIGSDFQKIKNCQQMDSNKI